MKKNELAPVYCKTTPEGVKVWNVYQLGRHNGHSGLDCTVMMFNKNNPNARLSFYGERSRSEMYMDAKQIEALCCLLRNKMTQQSILNEIGRAKLESSSEVVQDYQDDTPIDGVPEFDGEYMSSLRLAQIVKQVTGQERLHKTILDDIRMMLNSGVAEHKFVPCSYKGANGKLLPAYNLTKKGYLLYVSKFNDRVREQLIDRWEDLEQQVRKPAEPVTALDVLEGMIKAIRASNMRIDGIDARVTTIEQEREINTRLLLETDTSKYGEAPTLTDRAELRKLVNEYASASGIHQRDIYHRIYSDLYYKYGKRVGDINEAERRGLLGECKAIVADLIKEFKQSKS